MGLKERYDLTTDDLLVGILGYEPSWVRFYSGYLPGWGAYGYTLGIFWGPDRGGWWVEDIGSW